MVELLDCPFCGDIYEKSLSVDEYYRVEQTKYNKNGVKYHSKKISHSVKCSGCGAAGPNSVLVAMDENTLTLTESEIDDSMEMAALAWNARSPINKEAYELVSALITSAISSIAKDKSEAMQKLEDDVAAFKEKNAGRSLIDVL